MSTQKLSNISLKDFRKFLSNQGLNLIKDTKGRGGHEKWSRSDLDRPNIPIKFQNALNKSIGFWF